MFYQNYEIILFFCCVAIKLVYYIDFKIDLNSVLQSVSYRFHTDMNSVSISVWYRFQYRIQIGIGMNSVYTDFRFGIGSKSVRYRYTEPINRYTDSRYRVIPYQLIQGWTPSCLRFSWKLVIILIWGQKLQIFYFRENRTNGSKVTTRSIFGSTRQPVLFKPCSSKTTPPRDFILVSFFHKLKGLSQYIK